MPTAAKPKVELSTYLDSSKIDSSAKAKVDVCILEDDRILVLSKNSIIAESKLSKNNKIIKNRSSRMSYLAPKSIFLVRPKNYHFYVQKN